MSDYIICIPSYKRAKLCNEKTLATLHKHKIPAKKINIYVANKEEYDLYLATIDKSLYNKLIIGKLGLVNQRQFIMDSLKEGQEIVFMDDDVKSIDLSLSTLFKSHSLDYFIKEAFKVCKKENAYIWSVYPVYNPFFRKNQKEITTDLRYQIGAFYGIINRPKCGDLKLTMDNKEDVERTIKFFIKDGKVIRFNRIGFETKYYNPDGSGLGTFEARLKPMLESSKKLLKMYKNYGKIKTRKSGMTEFVLYRLTEPVSSSSSLSTKNKTQKVKNPKNKKTKKNKK